MRRKTISNVADLNRITIQEATERFIKHCRVRNLSAQTIKYYTEDCNYFAARVAAEYIDEVNHDVLEDFIFQEIENGKKVSSLNTRIRGLRVFFVLLYKLEFPVKECVVAYEYLRSLGYTAAKLFPGYDGVVKNMEEDTIFEKVKGLMF